MTAAKRSEKGNGKKEKEEERGIRTAGWIVLRGGLSCCCWSGHRRRDWLVNWLRIGARLRRCDVVCFEPWARGTISKCENSLIRKQKAD